MKKQSRYQIAIASLLVSLVLAPGLAEAKSKKGGRSGGRSSLLHSVKRDAMAASGYCLQPVRSEGEARAILNRNDVNIVPSANLRQLKGLSTAVKQIERLSGGESKYIAGVTVAYPKVRKSSHYVFSRDLIEMGANFTDSNVAHVTHELGHRAGRAGLYEAYFDEVPVCRITKYGRTNRNEEFAEVFAAFVTHPELLSRSPMSSCRRAYDFFLEVFPQGKAYASCEAKNQR